MSDPGQRRQSETSRSPGDAEFEDGRAHQQAGRFGEAEAAYRRLIEHDPTHFRGINNLGVVLEALGQADEALEAYRRACRLAPDNARVHYNLGRALQLHGDLEDSAATYLRAIDLDPGNASTFFNLGRLFLTLDRPEDAEAALRRALALQPDSPQFHGALGEILFRERRLEEALAVFLETARLAPDSAESLFDVAKALDVLGRHTEAEAAYRRSLALRADSDACHENLASLLQRQGRSTAALEVFDHWLEVKPGHAAALHLRAACTGDMPSPRAPGEYVESLFDAFADEFESTLRRLSYRGPRAVSDALHTRLGATAGHANILDAGCGTGLCGPLLRPLARRLEGVDLSEAMLARARSKGVYDSLERAEVVTFLTTREGAFDAIVSADTLVYFGALDDVLRAMAKALRPGGFLVITLERLDETSDGATVKLGIHGRYAHSGSHVDRAVASADLQRLQLEATSFRTEGGRPVPGWLVVAEAPR